MKLLKRIERALGLVDDSIRPLAEAVQPQADKVCDFVEGMHEKVRERLNNSSPAAGENNQEEPALWGPPLNKTTPQWFIIQSRISKIQFVPLSLLNTIYESMERRGCPDQSIHTTDYVQYESHELRAFPLQSRSRMEIPFDGMTLCLAAEDLPRLRADLLHAPQREEFGVPYFKIHSTTYTMCLTPEQRHGLIQTLQYKLQEANQLTAQDYNTR